MRSASTSPTGYAVSKENPKQVSGDGGYEKPRHWTQEVRSRNRDLVQESELATNLKPSNGAFFGTRD